MRSNTTVDLLMERVAEGDRAAFAELYDAVVGRVNGMALRVLRDPSHAEEITQEIMIEIWRKAPRFDRSRGSAIGWILAVAHRRAVDRVRSSQSDRNRVERHAVANREIEIDSTVEATISGLEAEAVRGAVATLSELQREAITLAYWGGLTYVEVAEKLSTPLGTVKTRIRDGLRNLADGMEGATA